MAFYGSCSVDAPAAAHGCSLRVRTVRATWLLVLGTLGCGTSLSHHSLYARTAGRIGCPARDIRISDVEAGTWTATCRGERYYCASVVHATRNVAVEEVNCSPDSENFAAETPDAPDDPVEAVTRTVTAGGPTFRATFAAGSGYTAHVEAKPVASPGRATLALEHTGARGRRSACSVRLMVDQELIETGRPQYEAFDTTEALFVELPFDVIVRIANAYRVSGRVCDEEFVFDDEDRDILDELVARVREEEGFLGRTSEPEAQPENSADAPSVL